MEQVPATISRRKLALGGPAAVALAPFAPLASLSKLAAVAPVGAAAVLGGVHTNASALTFSSDEFDSWFTSAFLPTAKVVALHYLRVIYNAYRSINPSWPSYTIDQIASNEITANDVQNRLGSAMRTVHALTRVALIGLATDILVPFNYSQADYQAYKNHFYNLSESSINFLKQHKNKTFGYINIFLFYALDETLFDSYIARTAAAEAVDDRRYLKGTTDDQLVEGKTILGYPNGTLSIAFGNKRALVERVELQSSRSFWSWIGFGPRYTTQSVIQHGVNSTIKEPSTGFRYSDGGQTRSDAFVILNNTDAGVDYYVDADIDKNGPFANMTDDQSRRMLRGAALFVAKDTGLVYESYVVTQLAIRAYGQAAISVTRQLINSKKIDLVAIIEQVKVQAEAQGAVSALAESSRTLLLGATGAITAGVLGAVVASAIVMFKSKEVVDENRSKNTTAAADNLAVKNRVLGILTGAQTTAQLTALGYLNFAAFAPGDSAPQRLKWIGGLFGLSDLTGAISDYVNVFRAGTQSSAAGFTQLLAGTARIAGAFVGVMSLLHKLTNWTFLKWFTSINPLRFNSATAAVAAFFYAFSMVLVLSQ